jgi:MYXO-CTERM domain-containing protein
MRSGIQMGGPLHSNNDDPANDRGGWRMAALLAAAAWLALWPAWVCAGGYTNKITTTPNYIQDNFGPAGDDLPFDGLEYCCPTAVTMSLSYLGINGFNQIGPADPTTAQGLNLDEVLSGLMGTDPFNGTYSITGAIATYLSAKGIGASDYSLTVYDSPTMSQLANIDQGQTVVDLGIGWYPPDGIRAGGHVIALDSPEVNAQGQLSPQTLAINNPDPGAIAPFADDPATSLQYMNTIPTSGNLTGDGALELDPAQYSDYLGTTTAVIEMATALTVNASEQSVNAPAVSPWTIISTQSMNLNNGTLQVIAPINGAGGISEATDGVLDLVQPDSSTGANTITAGVLESNVWTGQPLGTGSITLNAGTLELSPEYVLAAVNLTAASAAGATFIFGQGSSLILDANSNPSLTLTIGGNTDGVTPNLVRWGNGTLVIVAGDGAANLGTIDRLFVKGNLQGGNLPSLPDGIVAPYVVAQDNDANASADFVTCLGNGFVIASYPAVANYLTTGSTSITSAPSDAIFVADENQTLPAGRTAQVYALSVNGSTVSGGSNSGLEIGPMTSGYGGLILNGGSVTVPQLVFGAAEGLVYASKANGTISSVIQGSGGLTTFGPGTLTLSGNNAYTGGTNVESGILNAANAAGSATSTGAVMVYANATLEVSGSNAVAGGTGGTTINSGGTLWLNGGTLAGPLTLNGVLEGQGTISGPATLNSTIGSPTASKPDDITFTGSVTGAAQNSIVYNWQLDALDDNPADKGINWSLLNFTNSQVDFGTGNSNGVLTGLAFTLNLGAGLPDPNSGNPFWNVSHQWLVADSSQGMVLWYQVGAAHFAQGSFSISTTYPYNDVYEEYTPFPQPQGTEIATWNSGSGSWTGGGNWLYNIIPQAVGDTANFTVATAAPVDITLDAPWIVGVANFNNSQSYVLSAGTGGTLTMANGQLNAQINDTGGTHTISAPMVLDSSLTVDVSNYGDVMDLSGPISGPGGLTVDGAGTVTLTGADTYEGATSVIEGTLQISGSGELTSTAGEFVAIAGAATLNQTGGANATNALYLGELRGSNGDYDLSGAGSLSVSGNEYVGDSGTGLINQSGGTHTLFASGSTIDYLYLGYSAGSMGTYELSGASAMLNVTGRERIGQSGTGFFTQSGGTNAITGNLDLANQPGSTGNYILTGTTSALTVSGANAGVEYIGDAGLGDFLQSGGTNTVGSSLVIGNNVGSSGTYLLSGGLLQVNGNSYVGGNSGGAAGAGTLTVYNSGQLSVAGTLQVWNPGRVHLFVPVANVGDLAISGNGIVDVNGALKINYASPLNDPITAVVTYLKNGYNGGAWTGTSGIVSYSAANGQGGPVLSVGYADGNTDNGTPAGTDQIVIQYTMAGDANLDGSVNSADLLAVIQNFNKTGTDWAHGNFTFITSGPSTTSADLLYVVQNFNRTLPPALSPPPADLAATLGGTTIPLGESATVQSNVPIPEPSAAGMALAGLAGLLFRRRRVHRPSPA